MMYQLQTNDNSLGIPMLFPLTWEEHVAANMTKIPALELFPGVLVSDLYKAYRAGLAAGRYQAYAGQDPGDLIVGYIADTTGTRADVVKDFLDAMIMTINQGKAPADILTGQAATGIAEKTSTAAAAAGQGATSFLIPAAVIAGSLAAVYILSILPRPRG